MSSVERVVLKVEAVENGPTVVSGLDGYVVDGDGEAGSGRSSVALCRCGASSSKPFCDGSHKRVGFEATAVALELHPH